LKFYTFFKKFLYIYFMQENCDTVLGEQ